MKKTMAVGTYVANRKELPKTVIAAKLDRGQTTFMRRSHLLCVKWKDKRDVLGLSSKHKMLWRRLQWNQDRALQKCLSPTILWTTIKTRPGLTGVTSWLHTTPSRENRWSGGKGFFPSLHDEQCKLLYYKGSKNQDQRLKRKKCHMYTFLISSGKALGEKEALSLFKKIQICPLTDQQVIITFCLLYLV